MTFVRGGITRLLFCRKTGAGGECGGMVNVEFTGTGMVHLALGTTEEEEEEKVESGTREMNKSEKARCGEVSRGFERGQC